MTFVERRLLVAVGLLACACNSAPKNTCNPYANAIASAGAPPQSCNGECLPVFLTTDGGADSGTSVDICIVDCTDGGNAVCGTGTTCVSAVPIKPNSYCLLICGTDDAGNDAGSCPNPYYCGEAGVCL